MKQIRTVCGIIIGKRLFDEEYIIVDNILYFDDYKEKYKIKKQGDNLIDVLEEGRDLFINEEQMLVYQGCYNGIVDLYNCHTNKIVKFKLEECYELFTVITHEQYMKLKQTI